MVMRCWRAANFRQAFENFHQRVEPPFGAHADEIGDAAARLRPRLRARSSKAADASSFSGMQAEDQGLLQPRTQSGSPS